MKKLLPALSALFIAFALVACSNSSSTNNGPQAVTKQFFEALSTGDADTVLKFVHMPDMKKEAGDDKEKQEAMENLMQGKIKLMVQEAKEDLDKKGGVAEIIAGEPTYSDKEKKHAEVVLTMKFKNGEEDKSKVKLISTEAGWKVLLK